MSDKMETIREMMDRTGLHYGVIRFRIGKLGFVKRYGKSPNRALERVFDPDEVKQIEGYEYGKPGRPWKKQAEK